MKTNVGKLFLTAMAVLLCSCQAEKAFVLPEGFKECNWIILSENGQMAGEFNRLDTFCGVFDYKSSDNQHVYLSYKGMDTITVKSSKFKDGSKEFTYTDFVGYLRAEELYYLNLDDYVIAHITRFSKNETVSDEEYFTEECNKKAYQCASKGYYQNAFNLNLDGNTGSLEKYNFTEVNREQYHIFYEYIDETSVEE